MITKRISADEIRANLKHKVDNRIPIMISSAGSGLVAKLQEEAGTDCINTFSGARLRANGMGTMSMMWPILDSNTQTLNYTREDIMPALKGKSFVCACLNANDPLKDMRMVLEDCQRMGVNAVSNIGPSISYVDKDSEIVGLGFTMEDSIAICGEAKPDIFCFHAGTTQGGRMGYSGGMTLAQTAEVTEDAYKQCREVHPDGIYVAHGAALENPDDAKYILDNTSGHGFWTGSSTERLPIERAVSTAAKEFADLRFD